MAVLACFAVCFLFLLFTHFPFLDLPYHWDELGYFIPAAHDLLVGGTWIPRSTPPSAHPPLLLAYLAAVWKLFGFSVTATRVAMLVVAAATLSALFLLARRLAGPPAALMAVALMAVSPPFVAQSMLAHLDLAATLWMLLSLYWYLQGRYWLGAATATVLALTKETGILLPLALAFFPPDEKKRRLGYLLPPLALGCWLVFVRSQTGHWFGSAEFARYNLNEALDPARIPLALLRRLYQLGFVNFHWMATGLIVWAVLRRGALAGRAWRLAAGLAAISLLFHSAIGGALLFRYLLPAFALYYAAAAAALQTLPIRIRQPLLATLLAGLAISNWWNPPYPFGYEDNLAVTDFIRLQQQGAAWLSEHYPNRVVTTAWPLSDALVNPLGGYLQRPLSVYALNNFQPQSWDPLDGRRIDVVAIYSRSWEPERGWQRWPPLARLLRRHFGYTPQLSPAEVSKRFHLQSAARWERRGQWMEILVRRPDD